MAIVIADAGPLRYLIQIHEIDLLPRLFQRVFIPTMIVEELTRSATPEVVRAWMESMPDWLQVRKVACGQDPSLAVLDDGERAAIALGAAMKADLLLIDDRRAVALARDKGFEVTGTLGILDLAARRGMVDLASALARLRDTNFRRREELFDALLKQHRPRE